MVVGALIPYVATSVFTHVQSPFSGEDEDELFDSICNHQVSFSRYLDQTTISFLDKVHTHDIDLRNSYVYGYIFEHHSVHSTFKFKYICLYDKVFGGGLHTSPDGVNFDCIHLMVYVVKGH